MKEKVHYVIEAVLAVAVIILFVFQFSGNKTSSSANVAVSGGESVPGETMPIAYIDVDSLMANYTLSIDLSEQLTKQMENAQANLVEKGRRFQTEAAEFQRKMETNAFLNEERAKQEHERMLKKRDELQQLEATMAEEIDEKRFRLGEELRNTIVSQLQEYNKNKGFHIIYGKRNDNILLSDNAYNITAEVINFLNKQHAVSPEPKPAE